MTQDKKTEAREFLVELAKNRIFELSDGKFFIEYKGEPPRNPIHVIEMSAVRKLHEENEALRVALEFYASVESWNGSTYQYRVRIDGVDYSKVQGFDEHINFGGKRAREILAKYPRGAK